MNILYTLNKAESISTINFADILTIMKKKQNAEHYTSDKLKCLKKKNQSSLKGFNT